KHTGDEDQPRVDFVNVSDLPVEAEGRVLDQLSSHADHFDIIIVSDQAETERGGVVTTAVRDLVVDIARNRRKLVWVDSRMRLELFRNVVLKPNRLEAEDGCRRLLGDVDFARMFQELQLQLLIVTEGAAGARVIHSAGEDFVPGRQVKAVDICGAGDSFTAGAACALAITGSATEAARFGNLVASITVTKRGTGTASPQELRAL
ncbi:MAG TPA: PfkB family carbohydrate kinase, partial [Bryobacteraceae bacterium]|nr:PfkB family carbohydrate kinase [Bryobacteraceae bacterium]